MPALAWADPVTMCPGGTGALSGVRGSSGLWTALFLNLFIYLVYGFCVWVMFQPGVS